MHSPLVPMLGLFAPAALTLVGAGQLRSPAALSRAQTGAEALALGADGATWSGFVAHAPRFQGLAARLLIEGQRTNGIRNPRAAGAVAGAPGTLPTNWTGSTAADGIARQVVGTGVEAGIPYLDIRFSGTPTATGSGVNARPETAGAIAAASGQTWTSSFFLRLVAGSLANITVNRQLGEFQGATFLVATQSAITPTAAPLAAQRFQHTRTLNNASTNAVAESIFLTYTVGLAIDVTLRIGAPQIEQGAFASSPILPPVGAPAAATRGGDLLTAPLSGLGIGAGGTCTVLLSAMIPQLAPAGVHQAILQLDDGSDANRLLLRHQAGGASLVANRVTAGVAGAGVTAGSIAPGTPFRAGIACNGAGRIAASLEGAAAVAQTGGPTSGLTRLLVGSSGATGGAEALFGEIGTLRVLPYALADAALAAAVAALP